MYRKYIIYKDGQPTTDGYAYDYDIMPANHCPVDASSHTPGYKELFFSGKDGELKMHFWSGTDFTHVLLPTSKDIASNYEMKYVLDFQQSPSLKFSANTKYDSKTGTTMYQMILGGDTTNMYCDNNWILKGGKLISYSDGTRSICVCGENGSNLSVGDRVCIECEGNCVDIDQTSSCFSYSTIEGENTHILTVTSNPNGDAFIAIKRYMYITRIGY